jgi:hypothetical protein
MTREEAMTLLTRLHLIHTGMTGAGIELLIQIVQAGAAHEREACAKFVEDWSYLKECAGCDQPTPQQYAQAIRARDTT